MPLFLFIFFCILRYTYIHLITFIQFNYPSPFAEVSLHIFIAGQLSGKTSLWCRAENRIESNIMLKVLGEMQRRGHCWYRILGYSSATCATFIIQCASNLNNSQKTMQCSTKRIVFTLFAYFEPTPFLNFLRMHHLCFI
jgi:hypothetical protein